jgi:hypothetical protein
MVTQSKPGNPPVDRPVRPGQFQNTGVDKWTFTKRAAALKLEGEQWYPAWQDLSDYINPTRGFFSNTRPNQGKKIDHKKVLDSCAEESVATLAAGMLSGLTSPSRPWVKLELDDKDLMKYTPVKLWLDDTERRLLAVYGKSNVYGSLFSMYEELGTFGSACSFLQEDYNDVVRMRVYTAGEYYFGTSASGRVNSFYRRFWMTVGQMVEEFGEANVSDSTLQAFRNNQPDQWRIVNFLCEDNDKRLTEYIDWRNMAYRCVYWEDGSKEDSFLRMGGYEEFPILGPRWSTTTTADSYGRGPGWKALGHSRMLQKLNKDYLIALSKVVRPPVQVDASVQGEVNMAADGITRFSAMLPNAGVKPSYQINPDLAAMDAKILRTQDEIKKKFFVDLFLMLADAERTGRNVTAYEIMQKKAEAVQVLGPVLERTEGELLNPMNDRTLMIMSRNGLLLPPPEEIQGMELKFKYVSVLAQAQKMAGIEGIDQWRASVESSVQINPECIDIINYDGLNNEKAEMMGVPAVAVNDEQVMQQKRNVRRQQAEAAAEQQQQLAMAEAASKAGSAIKSVGSTPRLGAGSAMDDVAGMLEGEEE